MSNLSNLNKTCAVIPFYNEYNSLAKLVGEVSKFVDVVICVNDGSTDGSQSAVSASDKIILINNESNRGKGYSIRRGLLKGMELHCNKIITIDADLQHDPQFIPEFLTALDKYDFVIGNRLSNLKGMPFHRVASNKLTSFLLSIKSGYKIKDSQCGYRALSGKIIIQILPDTMGFEAETEMIIKACRHKLSIGFIDIPTIYGNEKSKMRNLQATLGFIKVYLTK